MLPDISFVPFATISSPFPNMFFEASAASSLSSSFAGASDLRPAPTSNSSHDVVNNDGCCFDNNNNVDDDKHKDHFEIQPLPTATLPLQQQQQQVWPPSPSPLLRTSKPPSSFSSAGANIMLPLNTTDGDCGGGVATLDTVTGMSSTASSDPADAPGVMGTTADWASPTGAATDEMDDTAEEIATGDDADNSTSPDNLIVDTEEDVPVITTATDSGEQQLDSLALALSAPRHPRKPPRSTIGRMGGKQQQAGVIFPPRPEDSSAENPVDIGVDGEQSNMSAGYQGNMSGYGEWSNDDGTAIKDEDQPVCLTPVPLSGRGSSIANKHQRLSSPSSPSALPLSLARPLPVPPGTSAKRPFDAAGGTATPTPTSGNGTGRGRHAGATFSPMWKEREVLTLLELYSSDRYQDKFRDPRNRKIFVWSEIAGEINRQFQTGRTGTHCDQKFRNIKSAYKHRVLANPNVNFIVRSNPVFQKVFDIYRAGLMDTVTDNDQASTTPSTTPPTIKRERLQPQQPTVGQQLSRLTPTPKSSSMLTQQPQAHQNAPGMPQGVSRSFDGSQHAGSGRSGLLGGMSVGDLEQLALNSDRLESLAGAAVAAAAAGVVSAEDLERLQQHLQQHHHQQQQQLLESAAAIRQRQSNNNNNNEQPASYNNGGDGAVDLSQSGQPTISHKPVPSRRQPEESSHSSTLFGGHQGSASNQQAILNSLSSAAIAWRDHTNNSSSTAGSSTNPACLRCRELTRLFRDYVVEERQSADAIHREQVARYDTFIAKLDAISQSSSTSPQHQPSQTQRNNLPHRRSFTASSRLDPDQHDSNNNVDDYGGGRL